MLVLTTEHETVTDFLPFGPAHGDSTVPTLDDGSTGGIQLGTDIGIFGSHQNRLYVSKISLQTGRLISLTSLLHLT